MFRFVVRYLRGLRFFPGLAHLFDTLLLSLSALTRPHVVTVIDTVTEEMETWPGVTQRLHRFGGVEFRLEGREIGHLHGNGLLDIPLTKALREQLVADGRAKPHHIYPRSGWVSFFLRNASDVPDALALLQLSYERIGNAECYRRSLV